MWKWLGLIGTPCVALSVLSMALALTLPACSHQAVGWLHAVHAAGLVLGVWFTVAARSPGRKAIDKSSSDPASERRHFVRAMAFPVSAFFTLVMAAEWFAVVVLSPCLA